MWQTFSHSWTFVLATCFFWLLSCSWNEEAVLKLPPASINTRTAENGIVWAHTDRTNKDLILLVHGWNGDKILTWSSLSHLLLTDDLLGQFDIATFGYPTGCFGTHSGIADIARDLDTFVNAHLQEYERIHIIAHSLGGLVTRRYIVDVLKERGKGGLKVEHLLLFATPNEGTRWYIGFFGTLFCGKQPSEARGTSTFISDLGNEWIKFVQNGGRDDLPVANRKRIPTLSIVATEDELVESSSASSYFKESDVKTGHTGMKEVRSHADETYLIMTNTLRSKSFRYTSVSDWSPDGTLKRYLRNWRESVRLQPDVLLTTHATTTRWTYIFGVHEVYLVLEKIGHHLVNRGVTQSMLKVGISHPRDLVFDNLYQRVITPRYTASINKEELPYDEVDIGDSFNLVFRYHAAHGDPFCAPGDPYGVIAVTNNSEIVEGYEVAVYAESAPSYMRAYYFDDAYMPWFVSNGNRDEDFTRLVALKTTLTPIDHDLNKKTDVSRLHYGRLFYPPMLDTRDTYLIKFSCDIFPPR